MQGFYKLFLTTSVVFLLLSVYLNISTKVDNRKIDNNFLALPTGSIEIYDEDIAKIDNFNDLKRLIDYEIKENNLEGIDIPIYIDDIVRKKYLHQVAYTSTDTNWVLKGADYFFPELFLATAMDPKELIKKNHGICSQQSIIFQELIKDYQFEYGSIRFNIKTLNHTNFGHFSNGVKVGSDWFYFDSNMEPVYNRKNSLIFKQVLEGDRSVLKRLYPQFNLDLTTKEMITFGDLNTFPAKRGLMFQKITEFVSNFLWFLFLMAALLLRSLSSKQHIHDK